MKKIFNLDMRQGFQFEVDDNLLIIRNTATDDYFMLDEDEIKLLEKAIQYLKDAKKGRSEQ